MEKITCPDCTERYVCRAHNTSPTYAAELIDAIYAPIAEAVKPLAEQHNELMKNAPTLARIFGSEF